MATRTTAEAVKEIIKTTLSEDEVEPYVTSANVMVTQILGTSLSVTVLTEIERWLAAHMIAVTKTRQTKREAAKGVSVEYTGDFGQYLASSSFGQMVMALDTTGAMASAGKKKASLTAITSFA